jgi:hypothetical protein
MSGEHPLEPEPPAPRTRRRKRRRARKSFVRFLDTPDWNRIRGWVCAVGLVVIVCVLVVTLVRNPATKGAWWLLISGVGIVGLIALWFSAADDHAHGRTRTLPRRIVPRLAVLVGRASVVVGLAVLVGGIVDSSVYHRERTVTVTVTDHDDGQIRTKGGGRYKAHRSLYDELVEGRTYRCLVHEKGHLALEPPRLLSCTG